MGKQSNAQQWSRLSLSTDGKVMHIRQRNVDVISLANMIHAVLKEIPYSPHVMKIVLEQYNQEQEYEQGIPGT